jgi:hypothetical protein
VTDKFVGQGSQLTYPVGLRIIDLNQTLDQWATRAEVQVHRPQKIPRDYRIRVEDNESIYWLAAFASQQALHQPAERQRLTTGIGVMPLVDCDPITAGDGSCAV